MLQVCKYIDMPLQHMNNLVLLAMNRPPRAHTENLLLKLRDQIPGVAIRTTFISGFPGETDEQHGELVEFCKSFKFARMGAFTFSEEDGTRAADLPEQVCKAIQLVQFFTTALCLLLLDCGSIGLIRFQPLEGIRIGVRR